MGMVKLDSSNSYVNGYLSGIRKLFHGDKWNGDDYSECSDKERSQGYLDGLSGKAPRGIHGGTGNSNASKEVKLDDVINVRINSAIKDSYKKCAEDAGYKSLNAWVLEALSEKLNRTE